MSNLLQPSIILLREGTDTSQGKPQLISNINACASVVDIVRTTLGPRGMDKLIYDERGNTTISNDGATIMNLLQIVHPAAMTLVDIAKSQDSEVGDGTTSVVLLAGELLKECKPFVEEGVHPQVIAKSYRIACELALKKIREIAVSVEGKSAEERNDMLVKCAKTAMNSKLIATQKDFFGEMVVRAVTTLDQDLDLKMIGIKKVTGGAAEESIFVDGVAFKKTFSYAGFEQQPKRFVNAKIVSLNVELELKAEKDNAEVRITDPSQYQSIVDAEWDIIYDKLNKILATGANVVLSRLAIGDLATQFFADRNVFCAGRVPEEDLHRVAKATGAQVQSSVTNLTPDILGMAALFEEKQVGGERYNFFTGCPQSKSCTLVLRGGAEQFIEEVERSIHDAIMVVRRAYKNRTVVAGGGAIEMELSRHLREHSRTIHGKQQLLINAFAKALEVIPRQLCDNAGFDSTDVLNKLRQKHAAGQMWAGVDITSGGVCDTFAAFVWEPALVKLNALSSATDAACLILSIDETVKNPKSDAAQQDTEFGGRAAAMGMGMGRGGPGMRGGRGRGRR